LLHSAPPQGLIRLQDASRPVTIIVTMCMVVVPRAASRCQQHLCDQQHALNKPYAASSSSRNPVEGSCLVLCWGRDPHLGSINQHFAAVHVFAIVVIDHVERAFRVRGIVGRASPVNLQTTSAGVLLERCLATELGLLVSYQTGQLL
jgi:hypothetical protein